MGERTLRFYINKKHKSKVVKLLNLRPTVNNPIITTKEETLKLIQLNINPQELGFELPYMFKTGDYVTCLDEIAYSLADRRQDMDEIRRVGTAWGKDKTFIICNTRANGLILEAFQGGVYLNWVRPATEEEIEAYKDKNKSFTVDLEDYNPYTCA